MKIRDLLAIESEKKTIQGMIDNFCSLTGLACVVTDQDGQDLTKVMNISQYCSKMRESGNACVKSDEKGLQVAFKTGRTSFYTCHAGVIDLAIPIMIDGQLQGSIMAGQVRLTEDSEIDFIDSDLCDKSEVKRYQALYANIPYMNKENLLKSAKVLDILKQYIIERITHLNNTFIDQSVLVEKQFESHIQSLVNAIRSVDYNEGLLELKYIVKEFFDTKDKESFQKKLVKRMREEFSDLGIDTPKITDIESNIYLKEILEEEYHPSLIYFDFYNHAFNKSLLSKAFRVSNQLDYVIAFTYCNFYRKITVKEIADYMNLSVDYFGRRFKKQYGMSYLDFLSQVRIKQAKYILKHKEYSVGRVGMIVGFSDASYFTRVFKKLENISPKDYKNNR